MKSSVNGISFAGIGAVKEYFIFSKRFNSNSNKANSKTFKNLN